MKKAARLIVYLTFGSTLFAQSIQPPANSDELKFFRYLLMTLGSLDYSQEFITNTRGDIIRQFGLNDSEAATIQSAAQVMRTTLQQIRQSIQSTPTGNSSAPALSALIAQRDQVIESLANSILASVRAETATRLRFPGNFVAQRNAGGGSTLKQPASVKGGVK
jgi:hypothetical protein